MEAGIEHLGRGTSGFVDWLLVVVEPGRRSVETAEKIRELARHIRLEKIAAVGNKVRGPADEAYLKAQLGTIPLIGVIPFRESLIRADMESRPPFDGAEDLVALASKMIDRLMEPAGARPA